MIQKLVTENSGSITDAQDVFQSALEGIFIKASQPEFRLTAAFSTYLYGYCHNLWRNELRKKSRKNVTIEEDDTFIDDFSWETEYVDLERWRLFDNHFSLLGEECRQILLGFFAKERMKVIALKLGVSVDNARQKKLRCQKRLTNSIVGDPVYQELRS